MSCAETAQDITTKAIIDEIVFFVICKYYSVKELGLFAFLGGAPVHESDNNCLSGSVTDVETDNGSWVSTPPAFVPGIDHIHLECLPFIGLLEREECLHASGRTTYALTAFTPEELAGKVSGGLIVEHKNCSRSLFLKRLHSHPRVSSGCLEREL